MGFDPEELGLPPEETSDPIAMNELLALAAQGAQMARQQQEQQRQGPRTAAAAAQQRLVAARLAQQQQQTRQPPTVLDEIEQRLGLAGYYRALLEQPLFADEADEFSEIVEREVRQFILNRLGELLGTNKPKPPPEVRLPFTPDEVTALRSFAGALLSRQPSIARAILPQPPKVEEPEQPEDPPPPEVRPAAPRTPKVRPARRPAQPEVAPAPRPAQPPPSPPRARRVPPRPVQPAPAPEQESEESLDQVEPSGEAPIEPVPMPRGMAFTAATANDAAKTMQGMDREIERQLKK